MVAARDLGTTKLLLESGADVHAQDNKQWRPLHYAATSLSDCASAVLGHLLDCGAQLEATTSDGETALHLASRKGNGGAVKVLIKLGAQVEAADCEGNTPLLAAYKNRVYRTRWMIAAELVESGADASRQNSKGQTALHILFSSVGRPDQELWEDTARSLVEQGANPHAVDHKGQTPLHSAVDLRAWSFPSADSLTDGRLIEEIVYRTSGLFNLKRWVLKTYGVDDQAVSQDGHTPASLLAYTLKSHKEIVLPKLYRTLKRLHEGTI